MYTLFGGVYSPYSEIDVTLAPISTDLTIDTSTPGQNTLYIKAYLNSGPSVAYIGLDLEICGLETIMIANTTNLSYVFDKNSGTLDI